MRGPFTLLANSWALVRQNFSLYFGIVAFPALMSFLFAVFAPAENVAMVSGTEFLGYLALFLITGLVSVLSGIALILALDNPSLSVGQAYKRAATFFWRYLGMTVMIGFMVAVPVVLVFILGSGIFISGAIEDPNIASMFVYLTVVLPIIFLVSFLIVLAITTWFIFAPFALVLQNSGAIESLKRGREYVRGRYWAVFGRMVALTVLAILVSIPIGILSGLFSLISEHIATVISSILSLVITPVLVGCVYLMYKDSRSSVTSSVVTSVS